MTANASSGLFVRTLLCALVFLSIAIQDVFAQQTITRDSLEQLIVERAQEDARANVPLRDVNQLDIFFGERANRVGLDMLAVYSMYEDAYKAEMDAQPWWKKVQSNLWGWITAGVVGVIALMWNVLKGYITSFLKWILEGVYQFSAGYKPFWWIALRKYRKALAEAQQELKIPFRSGKPLRMEEVYVPLKIEGTADRELIDPFAILNKEKRLMIVGAPGSGKTMFMRHIAYSYAREELRRYSKQQIPVLIELHRLNDLSISILDHLTAALVRSNFPNAKGFLKAGLKHGRLLILFDGLDEVSQEKRGSVIQRIKDFMSEGLECRAVVTCRSAVYNGEFSNWADKTLEIVEFDDQQIQSFLSAWEQEMPSGKSVDNLIRSLQERPRIQGLARNPLLLTIIAYLYCDTNFELPYSRAEFYDRSTNVLLDQWDQTKGQRNRFKAGDKRIVLQKLALYYQALSGEENKDRRSVPLQDVLLQIKEVLPSLNLKDDDARLILDEIVERSGLLLALDRSTRYQFTHLTLQEFFVAQALKNNAKVLIDKFAADQGAWREVLKLWCGLERGVNHDSTGVIQQIAEIDEITALECLGDTQQVHPVYAHTFIHSFLDRLGERGGEIDAILKALAIIAADQRLRGKLFFKELDEGVADQNASGKIRFAKARILALTNLPEATNIIAKYAPRSKAFRGLLVGMGNLAVPTLSQWANNGAIWAIDDLYAIRTSQAARALTNLLWSNSESKYHAAWRIGSLVSNLVIEQSLAGINLTHEQKKGEIIDWIWSPFSAESNLGLETILGRVAFLMRETPDSATYFKEDLLKIDKRIVVPFCALILKPSALLFRRLKIALETRIEVLKSKIVLHKISDSDYNDIAEAATKEIVGFEFDKKSVKKKWLYLFNCLSDREKYNFIHQIIDQDIEPQKVDWLNVMKPISFNFRSSIQGRFLQSLMGLINVLFFVAVFKQLSQVPFTFKIIHALIAIVAIVLIGGFVFTLSYKGRLKKVEDNSIVLFLLFCGPVVGTLSSLLLLDWIQLGIVSVFLVGFYFFFYFNTWSGEPIYQVAIVHLIAIVLCISFYHWGPKSNTFEVLEISKIFLMFLIPFSGIMACLTFWIEFNKSSLINILAAIVIALFVLLFSVPFIVFFYYPVLYLGGTYGQWGIMAFFVLLGMILVMLRIGCRLERRARNPLQSIIELEDNSKSIGEKSWLNVLLGLPFMK